MGITNPYELDPSELHHIVVGWMLEGRPQESQRDDDGQIQHLGRTDLLAMLEGDFAPDGQTFANEAIAEAYATGHDPMAPDGEANPIRIAMLRELRSAGTDKVKRAGIIVKYDRIAREANEAAAAKAKADG